MSELVECVPNFSVSRERDEAVFQGLVDTANGIPGCTALDVQTDGDHNRCVFTMVGSPAAIEEAAFQLAKKAAETIDMTKHQGQHPRMGATDVIPFIPTMDMTVEECVDLSKRVAERLWKELSIPSFLYEDSASRPERRNLAACRKGQFEGMPEKLLQPEWAPDYGERKIHPTAGITAIGARMPLIAYNINLDTSDLEIANKIARAIRAANGGFTHEGCGSGRTGGGSGKKSDNKRADGLLPAKPQPSALHPIQGQIRPPSGSAGPPRIIAPAPYPAFPPPSLPARKKICPRL